MSKRKTEKPKIEDKHKQLKIDSFLKKESKKTNASKNDGDSGLKRADFEISDEDEDLMKLLKDLDANKNSDDDERDVRKEYGMMTRNKEKMSLREKLQHNLKNETNDTKEYRAEYPNLEDETTEESNFLFLTGKIESKPDGDLIQNIHKKWWGNYGLLERAHGYIQWLFPIRIQGLNYRSQALQKHELNKLKNDANRQNVRKMLIKSYQMMLDFYGLKIKDLKTGELERTGGYKPRFKNLITFTHNNARITRILKCLGEFEMELYQIKFLETLIHETLVTKELLPLGSSLTKFWIHTIRNDVKRNELIKKANDLIEANI